jgi:hypothetical protein
MRRLALVRGTQCTCFTSTKVQILTQNAAAPAPLHAQLAVKEPEQPGKPVPPNRRYIAAIYGARRRIGDPPLSRHRPEIRSQRHHRVCEKAFLLDAGGGCIRAGGGKDGKLPDVC